MAEDPLRDIVEGVRARLQDELETQLRAVSERHQQALRAAQQRIEAEADARCAERIEALSAELRTVRAEYEQHVDAAAAAVRAEVEQQAAERAAGVRAAMEEEAREQIVLVRTELEGALANERLLAEARLEAERANAAGQREQMMQSFEAERAEWNARSPVGASAQGSGPRSADSLVRALTAIGAATSVSDSLAAIAGAAAAEAPRAALFVSNGSQLAEWPVGGLPPISRGPLNLHDAGAGIVVEAATTAHPVRKDGSACAAPLVLDGSAVGVLYGEAAADGSTAAAWIDNVEALARFGAAHLGYLTALRTTQARGWLARGADVASAPARTSNPTEEEAVAAARRYARLVVSEIKLYNETAVQAGRSARDLLERLKSEIERARRLYDERVPLSVEGRGHIFQQELVQTLAGGDPSLLG